MPSVRQSHRRQNSRSATQFVLNVSPIAFEDAAVRVGIIPYKDSKQLARLRSTHGATHIFRREQGTKIVAVPFVINAPDVGDSFKMVKLKEQLALSAALIRNAVLNHLHDLPRPRKAALLR